MKFEIDTNILIVLIVIVVIFIATKKEKYTTLDGYDVSSNDLPNQPINNVNTWNDCKTQCTNNNNCKYWNYNKDAKQCWLKGGNSVIKSVTTTGLKHQPYTESSSGMDIPGNDLAVFDVDNALLAKMACSHACDSVGNCQYWNYDDQQKKCWLKSVQNKPAFMTGLRQ